MNSLAVIVGDAELRSDQDYYSVAESLFLKCAVFVHSNLKIFFSSLDNYGAVRAFNDCFSLVVCVEIILEVSVCCPTSEKEKEETKENNEESPTGERGGV